MKKLLRILSCMSAIALATADPPSQAQISSNKLFVVNTNNVLPQNETNFFTKNAPLFSAWPNTIYVSAAAHAGNWLPIGADKPFALVLRLYDSPLSATAGGIEKVAAPTLHNEGCL